MNYTHISASFVGRARCPVGRSKIEYQDATLEGLLLEVRKSGLKTFAFRYRDERGVTRRHRIGGYPAIATVSARAEAKRLIRYMSMGLCPIERPGVARLTPAHRDALDRARMGMAEAIGGSASWFNIRICEAVVEFDAAYPH